MVQSINLKNVALLMNTFLLITLTKLTLILLPAIRSVRKKFSENCSLKLYKYHWQFRKKYDLFYILFKPIIIRRFVDKIRAKLKIINFSRRKLNQDVGLWYGIRCCGLRKSSIFS